MLSSSTLKAVCVGNDGILYPSSINLNDHYENRGGEFVSGGRHFLSTSQNLSLRIAESSIKLEAKLLNYEKQWTSASVDLAICIVNKKGQLNFEKQ